MPMASEKTNSDKNILTVGVTGATGFIGSSLITKLIEFGFRPKLLVRNFMKVQNQLQLQLGKVSIIHGDLSEHEALEGLCENSQVMVHCAAKVGDWGFSYEYENVNLAGTARLLDKCLEKKVKQFVYLSSMAVYGLTDFTDIKETAALKYTEDPYNNSKTKTELYVKNFCERNKIAYTIIRPGYVYGENDTQVIPRVISSIKSKKLVFIGSGNNKPNLTYIGNLVELILKVLGNQNCYNEIYHICDQKSGTIKHFIATIASSVGYKVPSRHAPKFIALAASHLLEKTYRFFNIKNPPFLTIKKIRFLTCSRTVDVSKAEKLLGKIPYSYMQGLDKTVKWIKKIEVEAQEKRDKWMNSFS